MSLRVHLINPSRVEFGVAVITPRWLYVLAAATGREWGDPILVDETLKQIDPESIAKGDVVTREQVIDVLVAHPEVMQRPVVFVGNRAVIARPSEKVLDLLD